MRGAALSLLAAFAVAMPAAAVADTTDVLKANTLVLTAPDGGAMTLLVADNGRMTQVNVRGMWAAGFWAMAERGFCWTARGESEVCIPIPADKAVGDTWEIAGPAGRVGWVAEIREGRADLEAVGKAIQAAGKSSG